MTSCPPNPTLSEAALRRRPGVLILGLALLGVASCATGRYGDGSEDRSSRAGAAAAESSGSDSGARAKPAGRAPLEDAQRVTMAFPTGNKRTSAVLLEKEMPNEVILGVPFEYRILVENLTDVALDTVRVTDSIPSTLRVLGTEPNADVAGAEARWNLGLLPARSTKVLVVQAEAAESGSIATCATVAYESSLCASTTVVSPALQVVLSAPEVGLACDPFDVTVKVTNAGTGDARDVTVVDELPDGLTTLTGQRRIEMEFGTLASSQSKEKSVKVKAAGPGTYNHAVRAEARGGLQAAADPVQTVLRAPVLTLSMSAAERSIAGRPIETVLEVANTGNGVATDAVVRLKLPQGAQVSESSEGARESSTGVAWDLDKLEPGETRRFSVSLTAAQSGTVVTEAKASAYCADEVVATSRTEVRGLPALLLELKDESDLIIVGEPVTYDIEITNQGSAPDMDINIVCEVEDGIEIIEAGGDAQATMSGKTVTFATIPTLAPGEVVSLRVRVKSSKPLNSRFRVSLTSDDMTRPVTENESTRFVE